MTRMHRGIETVVSVTRISFFARSLVPSVLWIAGWIIEFSQLGQAWFKRLLPGPA